MDSTSPNGTYSLIGIPLYRWFLFALLLCPSMAILAGLIHPLRIWAAAGEWCQVLNPSGQLQVFYGYQCDRAPQGLIRRFYQ